MDTKKKNGKKRISRTLWSGRLTETDPLVSRYTCSVGLDRKLAIYDIRGSRAHVAMLRRSDLLTGQEAGVILEGLDRIEAEIKDGTFNYREELEDIHMNIESRLMELVGEAGGKLHTARSRNDQVQLDSRLYMLDAALLWQDLIIQLIRTLIRKAEAHQEDLFPAWTHMQSAQPMSWGHYFLGLSEMLYRDYCRLDSFSELHDYSPLGAGALSGTSLRTDPEFTANELGFSRPFSNSYDVVGERDAVLEILQIATQIMIHLSRFSEDWIYMSSTAVNWINLPDEVCTGSSMMPQKKNPDMLELMRGKTGSVCGSLMAMLMMLKAQPSTYNRDMQEDKLHIFNAADTVRACLDMAAAIVSNTEFQTEHIAAGLDKGFLDATSLAEYLVKKGVPFRQAHGVVGGLVAKCEEHGKQLGQLSIDEFTAACDAIEQDVYDSLGAANVVRQYASEGAGGTKQVEVQLAYWKDRLGKR